MDPHFTRKPPTPPGPSSGSGGGAAGSSGNFISAANGSASSSSSVLMTDADGLRLYQNSNGSSSISGSSGTEQQRETEDQLQLAIKNTLACVRVLLNQPRASDLVRGFIGQSLAPANSTTNSSHLIDLRSLEASAAAHHHHLLSDDSLSSLNVTSTVQSASADSISDTAAASARVDLLGLYDRLPASTGSLPLDALSHEWQVLLVVIYSLTAISSFLLNMITLVVLSRCQRTELRKYLINLSLSDLLMSMFSIPFTYTEYMLGHWLFGAFLCPFIRFVVTLSVFVSIATMTVIGINRHLAIMYPLKRKNSPKWKHWRSWNKTHVIVGIWVLGTAISLPEYLAFAELPFCYNNLLYYECRNTWPDQIANPYTIFIFLSTFAIPLALLSYLYTSIGLKLWRRQMPGNVDVNRDLTMQTKRAKVVKMLLVVVVLFAVMWLPLQTFSMVNFLYPDIRGNTEYASLGYNIFVGTYFGCHWLGMAHSCVSPLVYCFMNKKFRTDLRNLLCPLRALVGGGAGGTGHSGLAGSKSGGGGMYESYNSATFRTSLHHNNNGGNNNNSQSHLPAHLRNNSVRQRDGGGASSNTHSMNSNSVRVRGSSGVNSTQHSFASRRLSKTNSLSSLGRTSGGGGASRCLVVGPQSSNELGKSSTSAESEVKSAATTTCMNQTSEQSKKQVVDDHEHQDRPKQSELSPPPVQGKSVSHKGHEVAPPSSDDTVLVKMKTSVQNCLYDRQVLMCKLSHETSATETLHEIDEESEEDEEEEEDDDDDDDDDDDEVDFEMNCETGSGRRVTIRHHKCDYAIMESGPGAILPSNGSNNNNDDRDGHGHEKMANV